MRDLTRRTFLMAAPLAGLFPASAAAQAQAASPSAAPAAPPVDPSVPASFPAQPPTVVQEMVGVSHGNVARVKELVRERPALARAAWDWGYGDWETALGAASHVGNREIAEILLANGAHPTIFSATMLGQLDVVKAFVAASPGIQRTRGPHGITLLSHAKAGGPGAVPVVSYLESLGDADPRYPNEAMEESAMKDIAGTYVFGAGAADRMVVSITARGALMLKREGAIDRGLSHHGGRVFNPVGAEAVRIRFEPTSGRASTVTIQDGPVMVTARRVT